MAIEEYWVLLGVEKGPNIAPTSWVGAAASAQVNDNKTGDAIKHTTVVVVEAESATEAIKGARQLFPCHNQGKAYGILKATLTAA